MKGTLRESKPDRVSGPLRLAHFGARSSCCSTLLCQARHREVAGLAGRFPMNGTPWDDASSALRRAYHGTRRSSNYVSTAEHVERVLFERALSRGLWLETWRFLKQILASLPSLGCYAKRPVSGAGPRVAVSAGVAGLAAA